ncbi:MAG TPA: hypothetical protein VEF34_20695 [Syntrophobacteraceae bacterium]|nr:hypothetical protein [Syntrophobacteraceae bacterium]
MPEQEVRQNQAAAKIDFKTLELEIDREIDSLFVPAAERTAGSPRRREAHEGAQFNPNRDKGQSGADAGAGVDLDALQAEIDKEIDNLLVPAARSGWVRGSTRISGPDQPEKVESTPPAFEDIGKYQAYELSGLIELFNAAYLSLDWEFSRQNIEKLIDALGRLEAFASRSSEAKTVLRILDVILKRLRERPHAVNNMLVQLIRDSQGLLAHMLLMECNTGPHEKQRLKDLIQRFQELRQRALAAKGEAKSPALWADTGARVLALRPKGVGAVAETPRTCESTDSAQQSPQVRRENLCLLVSCGKSLALPASCILRVARSDAKKRLKILKRGYATLADFTALFRRIRSGIMGRWMELPAKELKSFMFEPLEPDSPSWVAPEVTTAVLASDGQTHKIVFCDMASFIAYAEISAGPPAGEKFGPFESIWCLSVPVFDPRPAGPLVQTSVARPPAGGPAIRPSGRSSAAGD